MVMAKFLCHATINVNFVPGKKIIIENVMVQIYQKKDYLMSLHFTMKSLVDIPSNLIVDN